jgi:phytoene dehydrogenase-like protein
VARGRRIREVYKGGRGISVTSPSYDAVVIGAGPNGLAAAITLARAGQSVVVFEQSTRAGGGLRSDALTLPGFVHDVYSSVYPLGAASPFFASLPLQSRGVEWATPPVPVAHPLDGTDAVAISGSVGETSAELGDDRAAYEALFAPFVDRWQALVADVLAMPDLPKHPWLLARFGREALQPAAAVAMRRFRGARARALFAGLAAHSTLRLEAPPSAAVGLLLGTLAHAVNWPFVRGGASRLADALAAELTSLGGEIVTGCVVSSLDTLPPARSILCDVTPKQLIAIAGPRLSSSERAALARYRYGPGVFKVDWALSEPIPWRASACRLAGTVHVGGTLGEIALAEAAPWGGTIADRPFVLVTQPTVADTSRAPAGRHVAWGYCHVPHGSTVDMTARVETEVERFAPGFRDTILARHVAAPSDLERGNANLVGGAIGGGALDLGQMFARPTWRRYRTSAGGLYLCSSSTPPGGGVHGMCGYYAALASLRTARSRK